MVWRSSLDEARHRTRIAYGVLRREIRELREKLVMLIPEAKDDLDDLISKAVLLGSMAQFIRYADIYLIGKKKEREETMMVV